MRSIKTGRRTLVVTLLTASLLGLNAGVAYAHYVDVNHGSDVAWVDSTHDHLDVQDGECDGNYVYAEGYYGSSNYVKVYDLNGCSSGWGHGDGINFYVFRVCEEGVGCSVWKQVT